MKENARLNAYNKVRKTWEINPRERVVVSKKEYNRQLSKKEVAEKIEQELDLEDDFDFPHWKDYVDDNEY